MAHRRWWPGMCIGGVALVALLPAGAAGAGQSSKAAACRAVRAEERTSDAVGLSVERAIASGNFAASKQAMQDAYGTDERNVERALAAARSAPPPVRAAFKNLLSFVKKVRQGVRRSSNAQGLVSSFERLAKDPMLVSDGAAIAHWTASVCGGPATPTTTSSTSTTR